MTVIMLKGTDVSCSCSDGDTIMRSALRAGLGFPYDCNVGSCGNCRFDLLEGEVEDRPSGSAKTSSSEYGAPSIRGGRCRRATGVLRRGARSSGSEGQGGTKHEFHAARRNPSVSRGEPLRQLALSGKGGMFRPCQRPSSRPHNHRLPSGRLRVLCAACEHVACICRQLEEGEAGGGGNQGHNLE